MPSSASPGSPAAGRSPSRCSTPGRPSPTPTELTQIPSAGPDLRDTLFRRNTGEVAVAPNQPESVYYMLNVVRRDPASFTALYAPNGDYFRYRSEAMNDAYKKRDEAWMN